jgi:hypothetical protein
MQLASHTTSKSKIDKSEILQSKQALEIWGRKDIDYTFT